MKLSLRGFLLLSTCLVSVASARHVVADTTANCEKKGTVSVFNKGLLDTMSDTRKSMMRSPSSEDVPLSEDEFYYLCESLANDGIDSMKAGLRYSGQAVHTDMDFIEWLLKYNEQLICGLPETTGEAVWVSRTDDDQYYNGRTVTLRDGTKRKNPVGQHILKMSVEGKTVGLFAMFSYQASLNAENKRKVKELLSFSEIKNGKSETVLDFIERLEEDKNYNPELLNLIKPSIQGVIE